MIELAPAAVVPACLGREAGRAMLEVVRGRRGSVVRRAYATSPLRLLTPANHGHGAWIYTSSYGGGLVDGDRTRMEIDVGRGATAFVSTQASTKVYRSPGGTSADTDARVGPDGLLVLAPDPVVGFAGSTYRQAQRFELDDRGNLVLLDWMSAGRQASGERWAFDEYAARIEVRVGGRLLVHDALALRAADGDLARRLGRFDVLATAVLVGPALAAFSTGLLAAAAEWPVTRRAPQLAAASALGNRGCLIRLAGSSVERVGRTLRDLLGFVPALLGDNPWTRKW